MSSSTQRITDSDLQFCSEPTPLDALAFAYLHSILNSADDNIRMEIARRVNLVAWEKRVRDVVTTTFTIEKVRHLE